MENKKTRITCNQVDVGKYYRENFKSFLVVQKGKFLIETFCKEGKIDCETIKVQGKNWPESATFRLRYLTNKERDQISATDLYTFPGGKKRSQPFQHLLNRWLDEILVLDKEEFNKTSKTNKWSKSLLITSNELP